MDFFLDIIAAVAEFFADLWLDHIVEKFKKRRQKKKEKERKDYLLHIY